MFDDLLMPRPNRKIYILCTFIGSSNELLDRLACLTFHLVFQCFSPVLLPEKVGVSENIDTPAHSNGLLSFNESPFRLWEIPSTLDPGYGNHWADCDVFLNADLEDYGYW